MIQCPWSFTCHASDPQAPSLAARQSHGASTLGTHKLNLWMKFPKSILIAVTLGDLGDSELMMTCGKHSFKLPGRAFTLKVSLPFRSHWVFMSFLPVVQVKLKWGQCIPLYLDDLLKCLWQWAVGLTAPELHHTLYKGKVSEAAVSFHRGLSVGLGLAVHSHLGGASGFLYLQGFSNQQCVTPGSECSCWLSDSGVPVWPCSSAVKRKPDKFSEAFFFFLRRHLEILTHTALWSGGLLLLVWDPGCLRRGFPAKSWSWKNQPCRNIRSWKKRNHYVIYTKCYKKKTWGKM